MPQYIEEFYHKETDKQFYIRKVFEALESLYPWGGNQYVISKKTNTDKITARNYLHQELAPFIRDPGRDKGEEPSGPGKKRYNIENYSFVLNRKKGLAQRLSPGYVNYKPDFLNGWDVITKKSEVDSIHGSLVKFLRNIFTNMDKIPNEPTVKKIKPRVGKVSTEQQVSEKLSVTLTNDMRCKGCGINHEARDFIRATLLHLADLLETNEEYINFLDERKFLALDARDRYLNIAKGEEPIKTLKRSEEVREFLYYREDNVGEIKTLNDYPKLMLNYIYRHENQEKYFGIVEKLAAEFVSKRGKKRGRIISNQHMDNSEIVLDDKKFRLRVKAGKERDRLVKRIKEYAAAEFGYSKDDADWQVGPR